MNNMNFLPVADVQFNNAEPDHPVVENNENIPPDAPILWDLISKPEINTDLLKAIYMHCFHGQNNDGMTMFLANWGHHYLPNKGPLLYNLCNEQLDSVATSEGCDKFYNTPEASKVTGEDLMDLLIKDLHHEYRKSRCLNNIILEKMIVLRIAREYANDPFFDVFKYVCLQGNQDIKNSIISKLRNLKLVGWDVALDGLLLLHNPAALQ